ncbi:MAG: type II secretion system protein [Pseudomonadota bacterium]
MFGPRFVSGAPRARQAGFTLPELIAVMVIVVILAAVAAPKFWGSGFDEVKLQQETIAALRYAQRFAIAQQRTVCVVITTTTATFTYDATYGNTACPSALVPPGGGAAPFTVTAQGTATYAAPTSFNFDRTGRPSAAQIIALNSGPPVVIEDTTGYVH